MLIRSLVEILWQAGEKTAPCVVHVTDRSCFEIPARAPDRKSSYYGDGITERVGSYSTILQTLSFIFLNLLASFVLL